VKWNAAILVSCMLKDDQKHNRLFVHKDLQDQAK